MINVGFFSAISKGDKLDIATKLVVIALKPLLLGFLFFY